MCASTARKLPPAELLIQVELQNRPRATVPSTVTSGAGSTPSMIPAPRRPRNLSAAWRRATRAAAAAAELLGSESAAPP